MRTTLRTTLLPLVIGTLVAACSSAPTPVDPEASSARDVDGGLVLHGTALGAVGVGNGSGGATPVDRRVSSARDVHGEFLPPPVSTNGAGEGRVHPFDIGSCQTNSGGKCCFQATCPSSYGAPTGTWDAAFTCSPTQCADSLDYAHNNGMGAIANATIELVFWGRQWGNATSPSVAQIQQAIQRLINSTNYFSGLVQYGTSKVTLDKVITDVDLAVGAGYYGDPGATYAESDVQSMVDREVSGQGLPPDPNGNDTIYLVMMPPGTTPSSNVCGANGANGAWDHNVAYVGYSDLDNITKTVTHELVEAITDPSSSNPGTGWEMNRSLNGGNQLGDACNTQSNFLDGILVQAYWSNNDHACIIPWPVCGGDGQACCNDPSGCTSPCVSGDVCSGGTCAPCGGHGELCCPGSTCPTAPGDICDTGVCVTPLGAPTCSAYSTCTGANNTGVLAVIQCNAPPTGDTYTLQQTDSSGNWVTVTPSVTTAQNGQWTADVPQTSTGYRVCVKDQFGQSNCTGQYAVTPATCTCVPTKCTGVSPNCGTISDGCGGTEHCTCCPTGTSICALTGTCLSLTKCNQLSGGSGGGTGCKPGTCQ